MRAAGEVGNEVAASTVWRSEANVRAFATAWYTTLSQHRPFYELSSFLAAEGLVMIFPEKTLNGVEEVEAWYLGGRYRDGGQAVGVCNVFFDEQHTILDLAVEPSAEGLEVKAQVAWQASWFVAPEASARRTAATAHQHWRLLRPPPGQNRFDLAIASYNAIARPMEFAAGFARL